jgi:hypothetical protein
MNILPPEPPLNGTFVYITSISDRKMYFTAYKAITMTESWDYIKNMTSIFNNQTYSIYNKIEELGYYGHSGCSLMCTLREMQFIAKYGEKMFKEKYDAYEKKASTDPRIQERRRILVELQNEDIQNT